MFVRALAFVAATGGILAVCQADDWMFRDAPYARDQKTGQRVEQFEQPKEPDRVPYDKFFNEEHPYIPYQFYWDEEGFPGMPGYGDMPYNGNNPGYPGWNPGM